MCQIQAIQFTKNGTSYFPGCSATLSDTIGVEVLVSFTSSEVNKRYFCFLQYKDPVGNKSRYVSDTPALISSAGTYSLSIFKLIQSSDPVGTYTLQTATIMDEAKSVSVCYGSASGNCTSVNVSSAPPPPLSLKWYSCPSEATAGQKFSIKVEYSGGKSPYKEDWYQNDVFLTSQDTIGGVTSVISGFDLIRDAGTYRYHVKITDSSSPSLTATSTYCNVTVQQTTQCSQISGCTVSAPSNITQGTQATFNISWSGDQAPYTVDLYTELGYLTGKDNISGTSTSVITTVNLPVGTYKLYANIWYRCSDGTTPSCMSSGAQFNVTSPGGPVGYNCSGSPNYQCTQAPSGTTAQYPDLASCQAACKASPPPTEKCPTNQWNIPGFGCQDKQTVMAVGVGFLLLNMMMRR